MLQHPNLTRFKRYSDRIFMAIFIDIDTHHSYSRRGPNVFGFYSMDNSVNKFLEFFIQSAKTHVMYLKTSIPNLSQDSRPTGIVVDLHRSAHSLKGECLAMGYQTTGELAHLLEIVFHDIKMGTRQVTEELILELTSCIVPLESSLKIIEESGQEQNLSSFSHEFQTRLSIVVPTKPKL